MAKKKKGPAPLTYDAPKSLTYDAPKYEPINYAQTAADLLPTFQNYANASLEQQKKGAD